MADLFPLSLVVSGDVRLPYVAGVVAKGTLLLALVFAAAALLRRTSASARHLVWSIGLAAVLALPFLSATLPWHLRVLPTPATRLAASIDAAYAERGVTAPAGPVRDAARREATGSEPGGEQAVDDGVTPGGADRGGAVGRDEPVVTPRAEAAEAAGPDRIAAAAAATRRAIGGAPAASDGGAASIGVTEGERAGGLGATATVILALLALWAAGAAVLLGRVAVGAAAVRRIARRAEPLAASDWTTPYYEAADRLDLDRLPRLLMSGGVTLPFTFGLFRPTIVLPASASEWTDDRRRAVLLHELGHVRRFDLWSHLVGRLACALYWFHPLVWMAAKRARAESERACDDLVLRTGTRASTYADHLLQIVRGANRASAPAVAIPMAQRNEFEGRMLAILEPDVRRDSPGRAQSAVLVAAVALLTFGVAAMAPAPSDAAPADAGRLAAAHEAGESAEAGGAAAGEAARVTTGDAPAAPTSWTDAAPARGEESTRVAEAAGSPMGDRRMDAAADAGEAGAEHGERTAARDAAVLPADTPTTWTPWPGRAPWPPGYAFEYWSPDIDVSALTEGALDAALDAAYHALDAAAIGDVVDGAIRGSLHSLATPMPMPAPTPGAHDFDFDFDYDFDYDEDDRWAPLARRGRRDAVDTVVVRALVRALEDSEVEVRRIAAHTLGEIGDPLAVPGLSRTLREDEDAEVRRMAAWALAEIEDPAAVPALARALREDGDVTVRRRAAWALGEIEDTRALAALGTVAGDADVEVARMAVWAIGEIGAAEGAARLTPALAHSDEEVRRMAAWAYGELDTERASPALVAALSDASEEVRRTAAWALGEIGDPTAAGALLEALGDDSEEVRHSALWALGEIGGQAARNALIEAIRSDDPEIRKLAARALARTY